MLYLAWRQLWLEPARSLLTGVAVAAVIAVMLIIQGFEQGQYYQLQRMVMERGADLIVTQAGVENMVTARSSLPQLSRQYVEGVAGVDKLHPLTGLPVMYEQDGFKMPTYMLVYDTKGGPLDIIRGRAIQESREIVIDLALAERFGLQPGQIIEIADFEFTIAGITSNESVFFMPVAFVNYDGLIDFYLESEIASDFSAFPLLSFLLVDVAPGYQPEAVARQIEASVAEVDVFTLQQMAQHEVNVGKALLGPIMGLLVMMAYLAGLLVVALIMHADVMSRLRHFGVLMALGFGQGRLVTVVFFQTALLLLAAFPAGFLVARGFSGLVTNRAPLYLVRVDEPLVLLQTIVAGCVIALLASLVPLRMIRRTDPMIVFQGV